MAGRSRGPAWKLVCPWRCGELGQRLTRSEEEQGFDETSVVYRNEGRSPGNPEVWVERRRRRRIYLEGVSITQLGRGRHGF